MNGGNDIAAASKKETADPGNAQQKIAKPDVLKSAEGVPNKQFVLTPDYIQQSKQIIVMFLSKVFYAFLN